MKQLRILILQDTIDQAKVIEKELQKAKIDFSAQTVINLEEYRQALHEHPPDIIVTEYALRSRPALEPLTVAHEVAPSIPSIIVTGPHNGEDAMAAIRAGAADYVTRNHLSRLGQTLLTVLENIHEREKRERAETALKEREETLRLITDNTSDLIAVLDTEGRRLYNSPSYSPILGDTKKLRGSDSFSEVHPDDRERIRETFLETVRSGNGQRTEYRLLSKDGKVRYIESVGNVIRGRKGKPSAVVVVSRDITDRRQAEEVLRQSEQRFRTLIENSSDAIALIGQDGTILYESPSVIHVLGYEQDELLGRNTFELVNPVDLQLARNTFSKILTHPEQSVTTQIQFRHKNGAWKWIEGMATNLLADEQIHAVVVNYRDITERKQAELDTERSLSLMKATIESTADGILVVDNEGKIITCNQKFVQMWRIPREIMDSREDDRALMFVQNQLASPEEFLKKVRELYSRPQAESFDMVTFKDGRVFERFSQPQLIKDQPVGRVWSFRDVTDKHRSAEAILLAKAKYEDLVNTIDGIVWEADPATLRFTFVSDNAFKLLGYPLEEWVGPDFWKLHVHPDDREWTLKYSVESTKQLQDHEFEFRLMSHDGHVIWLRDIVSIILENNRPVKLRGVMVDVTERKRMEELHNAVYRIAQAADSAEDLHDLYGRVHSIIGEVMPAQNFYISLYDEAKNQLSFPYFVDEVDDRPTSKTPGKGLTEYVLRTGKSLLCDKELDKELQEKGETELIGVYSPVWLGVPLILDQKTIGVMVVQHYSDPLAYGKTDQQILEFVSSQVAKAIHRKRTEETLKESEQRYRVVSEQTGQLVYDYDVTSGHITWSGAIESLTGYTMEEFRDIDIHQWEAHIHPEDRKNVVDLLAETMWKGIKHDAEYRFRRKDGTYRNIQDHGVFLSDAQGKPPRMLGTMNDVSERKKLEEQLVQSQKMEAVGQLASGIAHDFNNVMGVVLTASHLIKSVSEDKEVERYVTMIEGATLRGSAIAKQLLQFSRAEVSKLAPISISRVVTDVKRILDHSFPKMIRVNVLINTEQGVVLGDEGQIHQVLLNLCINARDAMTENSEAEPHGTLTIDVHSAPAEVVTRLFPEDSGKYVVMRVSDTGTGVKDEVRRRMFDPFFTTKGIGKGTGLGLSIVHGIVKNHHGHIAVDSTVGEGTSFSIYFPVLEQKISDSVFVPVETVTGKGETILVIEDEDALRILMTEILTRAGYKVLEARDGEQGVAEFKRSQKSIRLVVSDIGLPKLSGEAVLRELIQIDPRVKVIFSTGFLEDEHRADLLRTGALEVIHKPYQVIEVLHSVQRALQKNGSQA